MTGSVITYRARSAVRDLGKVLSFPAMPLIVWPSRSVIRKIRAPRQRRMQPRSGHAVGSRRARAGLSLAHPDVGRFLRLWEQMQDLPRHFAQHPGGMVIAAGRLDEVVPLEPAAMPGRLVMQWDKDDCEDLGIVKIDLLGLGMLAALSEARALVLQHSGQPFDLHTLPADDAATYDLIARGDTVGSFFRSRVERRWPSCRARARRASHDLVVQVGLIRPGPIIGDMVHPYLRRRSGRGSGLTCIRRWSRCWRAHWASRCFRNRSRAWR